MTANALTRAAAVLSESGLRGGTVRLLAALASDRMKNRLLARPDLSPFAAAWVRSCLAPNREKAGSLRGETAYVLATGPSLAHQPIERLAGKAVISINEMFSYLPSRGVIPRYLVIQDPVYFSGAQRYSAFVNDLFRASAELGIEPLLNVAVARSEALKGRALLRTPLWFQQIGTLLAYRDATPPSLDFSCPVPGLLTATHAAVAWALYLGAREVMILGVDLDYADDLSKPIRHCYGANIYNDHDRLSADEAYRRGGGVRSEDVRRHVREQIAAYEQLDGIARGRGQVIYDATINRRLGSLEKRDAFA